MSTTLRASLIAVSFLFAAGCAAEPFAEDASEEQAAQTQDDNDDEVKVEEGNLALMKKGRIDTLRKRETALPKK